MLVRLRETSDGAGMQTSLVREGRRARIRIMARKHHVAGIGHELRDARQLRQVIDARAVHLQLQVGNDRQQVHVAHALTIAVDGALHLRDAGFHGRQRVRHGTAGIVVAVDAECLVREAARDVFRNACDLGRQRTAVRLAQVDGIRARLMRHAHNLQGVFRVAFVSVEEVLGIEHYANAALLQVCHGFPHHAQILFQRGLQRALYLGIPALSHDGANLGAGFQQIT